MCSEQASLNSSIPILISLYETIKALFTAQEVRSLNGLNFV
jgi:hypothetical protein